MSWPEGTYKDVATLWRQSARDEYGQITWAAPVACKAAWADMGRLYLDEQGQQKVGRAVVMLNEDFAVGDRLLYGASTATTPTSASLPIRRRERQRKLGGGGVYRAIL